MKKAFFLLCANLFFGDFSHDFIKKVHEEKNWIVSPYSVSSLLEILKEGANGNTYDEIQSLTSSYFSRDSSSLKIANNIWVKEDLFVFPSFEEVLRNVYNAEIEKVSFNKDTLLKINNQIAHKTENKIQGLVDPSLIQKNPQMVLTSALYFQGDFVKPFNTKYNSEDFFYTDETSFSTTYLNQTAQFPYYENEAWQAVTFSFQDKSKLLDPVCIILLPNDKNTPLSKELIHDVLQNSFNTKIQVTVPKFTIETKWDLKTILQNLGMKSSFTQEADFSRISTEHLQISDFVHKAFFSFEETGVIATAATSATMICTSTAHLKPISPIEFVVDHPFYFLLVDRNLEEILFAGYIQNPCP